MGSSEQIAIGAQAEAILDNPQLGFIRSEELDKLAVALVKAQQEIESAHKDSDNPFYSSKYADLASVIKACRPALTKNGISVIQLPSSDPEKNVVSVLTLLLHTSGQFVGGRLKATPVKELTEWEDKHKIYREIPSRSPQAMGSCISYLRRYSYKSAVGVPEEDDDGNRASGKGGPSDLLTGKGNGQQPTQAHAPSQAQPQPASVSTQKPPQAKVAVKPKTPAAQTTSPAPAPAQATTQAPAAGKREVKPPVYKFFNSKIRTIEERETKEKTTKEGKTYRTPFLAIRLEGVEKPIICWDSKLFARLRGLVGESLEFRCEEKKRDEAVFFELVDFCFQNNPLQPYINRLNNAIQDEKLRVVTVELLKKAVASGRSAEDFVADIESGSLVVDSPADPPQMGTMIF